MTQDELKQQAALRALDYVVEGAIVGVGTGSTANFFIDGLATMKDKIAGAVASSEVSARRLAGHGIRLFDLNDVEELLREGFVTDNGNLILDVHGLQIHDPVNLEVNVDGIVGVVTNGLFAKRGADVLLLATAGGVVKFERT